MSSKVAVFQISTSGMDGRSKEWITFSSLDEGERDRSFNAIKTSNQGYYSKHDRVLDLKVLATQLINKLNGNDQMIIELCTGNTLASPLIANIGDNSINLT